MYIQHTDSSTEEELTLEIVVAISTQAFLGLLTMVLTFRSRSSSAVFWDCQGL